VGRDAGTHVGRLAASAALHDHPRVAVPFEETNVRYEPARQSVVSCARFRRRVQRREAARRGLQASRRGRREHPLITGEGGLATYETFPPLIAIPLGPEGGAGSLGEGVADAATIAAIKGRDMRVGTYAGLFDSAPAPA
jgi:hypothetical protein